MFYKDQQAKPKTLGYFFKIKEMRGRSVQSEKMLSAESRILKIVTLFKNLYFIYEYLVILLLGTRGKIFLLLCWKN